MAYHPEMHRRQSIRLRDYDYSCAGAYFVTVCAWQRECLFGEVIDGEMRLNSFGSIVQDEWVLTGIQQHGPRTITTRHGSSRSICSPETCMVF